MVQWLACAASYPLAKLVTARFGLNRIFISVKNTHVYNKQHMPGQQEDLYKVLANLNGCFTDT